MITGVIRIRAVARRFGKEVNRLLDIERADDTEEKYCVLQ
jgi:hypothetical protein